MGTQSANRRGKPARRDIDHLRPVILQQVTPRVSKPAREAPPNVSEAVSPTPQRDRDDPSPAPSERVVAPSLPSPAVSAEAIRVPAPAPADRPPLTTTPPPAPAERPVSVAPPATSAPPPAPVAPRFARGPEPPSAPTPHPRHMGQKTPTPPSELTGLLDALRELFAQDRATGSRADAARCGLCYLTFPRDELVYVEDAGYYACRACAEATSNQRIMMLHRQRKLGAP